MNYHNILLNCRFNVDYEIKYIELVNSNKSWFSCIWRSGNCFNLSQECWNLQLLLKYQNRYHIWIYYIEYIYFLTNENMFWLENDIF